MEAARIQAELRTLKTPWCPLRSALTPTMHEVLAVGKGTPMGRKGNATNDLLMVKIAHNPAALGRAPPTPEELDAMAGYKIEQIKNEEGQIISSRRVKVAPKVATSAIQDNYIPVEIEPHHAGGGVPYAALEAMYQGEVTAGQNRVYSNYYFARYDVQTKTFVAEIALCPGDDAMRRAFKDAKKVDQWPRAIVDFEMLSFMQSLPVLRWEARALPNDDKKHYVVGILAEYRAHTARGAVHEENGNQVTVWQTNEDEVPLAKTGQVVYLHHITSLFELQKTAINPIDTDPFENYAPVDGRWWNCTPQNLLCLYKVAEFQEPQRYKEAMFDPNDTGRHLNVDWNGNLVQNDGFADPADDAAMDDGFVDPADVQDASAKPVYIPMQDPDAPPETSSQVPRAPVRTDFPDDHSMMHQNPEFSGRKLVPSFADTNPFAVNMPQQQQQQYDDFVDPALQPPTQANKRQNTSGVTNSLYVEVGGNK